MWGIKSPRTACDGRGQHLLNGAQQVLSHDSPLLDYCRCGRHPQRATARFMVDAESGCYLWQGSKMSRTGYGVLKVDGRRIGAHRHFYEVAHGPIPDGLVIDHLCRNPLCVNPSHLEAVTDAVNVRRGSSPKLSLEKAREIRRLSASVTPNALAATFGVRPSIIRKILAGTIWREGDHRRKPTLPRPYGPRKVTAGPSPAPAYCQCGCGAPTSVAASTRANRGWVQGERVPFIRGHHTRRP